MLHYEEKFSFSNTDVNMKKKMVERQYILLPTVSKISINIALNDIFIAVTSSNFIAYL